VCIASFWTWCGSRRRRWSSRSSRPTTNSWLKFDHYAAHRVDEVLIADPRERTLDLFVLVGGRYERAERSPLLGVSVAEVHEAVAWPGSQ
jgi:hypothetical protein